MAAERLDALLIRYPYFLDEDHCLNELTTSVQEAVAELGDDAEDRVEHLAKEIESEERTLAAAYRRFDRDGSDALDAGELRLMNEYLGFPCSADDIREFMSRIDDDGDGTVSFGEFVQFVGELGGSMKLYEVRRRQLAEKGVSFAEELDAEGLELQRANMRLAGIEDDAQAYWRLVVPPSEFREAAKLTGCQRNALGHIRHLAKTNHETALPKLQMRIMRMGYADTDLWMTLAWIREMAPIIIHLNLDKMLQFIEGDTNYRNQFETRSSGGLLNLKVRERWERDLFGGYYDGAEPFEKCKYGVLNVMNDHRGVIRCAQYGDSYMISKDTRLRCTFSPEDSANLKAERLAVLDYYAHVLFEYTDDELTETLKVAQSSDEAILGDSDKVDRQGLKYKEAQFHGEFRFDTHVERLVAHTRHRDAGHGERIQAACRRHGFAFSWMDEEQERMAREDQHKLGGEAWKERLSRMDEDLDVEVEEGFCKVGCGRPVAPGVTAHGNPFTTCCRGCVMGFGHDLRCGTIDPSKVGPGKCKNGCGRPNAPGEDRKGRPFTTCCRNCALGLPSHSPECGIDEDDIEEGMCKMGCGRKVAPGTTRRGQKFDTCCRGCARGRGHSNDCIEE